MGSDGTATVTVVGEALVDIIERPGAVAPAEHPGGSPANVALTVARLGHDTHLLTRLGTDARGTRVAAHLADSGVRLVPGSMTEARTSTAVARIGAGGAATYEFDLHWELPDPLPEIPPGTVCVHTGSIAALLSPGADQVLRWCAEARHTATISYDPNLRPSLIGTPEQVRPEVEQLVTESDVVKLSDEDAAWLAPGVDPEALAAGWLEGADEEGGPAVVVVTRGGQGAVAFCAAGRVEVPQVTVAVADTVGAGDSFSGALIDGLAAEELLGADRRDALRAISVAALERVVAHAARVAAVTVSRPGADPPRRSELG